MTYTQPVSVKTGIKFLRTVAGKEGLKGSYGDLVARKSAAAVAAESAAAVAAESAEHSREMRSLARSSSSPHTRASKHRPVKTGDKAVDDGGLFVSLNGNDKGRGNDRGKEAARPNTGSSANTGGPSAIGNGVGGAGNRGNGSAKQYGSQKVRPQTTPLNQSGKR